ncbi:hypothetical protein HZA98_00685 [Candidatus Woesearchaeota archaeon]|nr:hypothetical protein [Candidatus Woesearchaeota archaeon]
MEKGLEERLTKEEKDVFKKILPLKLYSTGDSLGYNLTTNYSMECNTCKQCPGCGCMCNND